LELASLAPQMSKEKYDLDTKLFEIGDYVYPLDGDVDTTLVGMNRLPKNSTAVYTFTVEDNHNFYANGILTHNKK